MHVRGALAVGGGTALCPAGVSGTLGESGHMRFAGLVTARKAVIESDSITQMGDKKVSLVVWEGVSGKDRDRV